MQVAAPAWKWEWNLNTLVVLIGFAGGFVAWGYTLADIRQGRIVNASEIEKLDKRVTTIEAAARRMDTMELRLSNVEKQATDAASAMRAVEATLNGLAADMRVTREILQRIEATQNGRAPP
jgi:hypothetical protein